jgi:uncharacterized protein with GYD domain
MCGAIRIPRREGEVRIEMSMFIILGKLTQKGIENMKALPERLEASRKAARSVGVELKEFYYTMGRYDWVAVCEAQNLESMTKHLLMISGAGAVTTETLSAIPSDKAADIIKGLP